MKLHALLTLSLFSISSSLFGSAAQVKNERVMILQHLEGLKAQSGKAASK